MATKAAVYARISSDPQGLRAGVGRQERECRALAEREGWDVGELYVDNDVSAYSGKRCPRHEAMLAAIKTAR
ncbi:MAG: recombinase family protein [Sporichthyaceae bacterium]